MTKDTKKTTTSAPVSGAETVVETELKYTKAEWEAVGKAKGVEKLNQILRGFGLVAIILFYLIAVELFFEPSLFGLIFTPKEFHAFWYFVSHTGEITNAIDNETILGAELIDTIPWITEIKETATVFDDWLQWGTWFPVTFVTAIEIMITVGFFYIVVYSVRDIFGIIKNLITSARGTVVELSTVVKDNFEEETKDIQPKKSRKKVKKEKESDVAAEVKNLVAEVKKETKTADLKQINIANADDLDEKVLDDLLSYPHTEEEQKLVDSINNSSATAPRNRLIDKN